MFVAGNCHLVKLAALSVNDQFARFTINAELHMEEVKRILDEHEPGYAS